MAAGKLGKHGEVLRCCAQLDRHAQLTNDVHRRADGIEIDSRRTAHVANTRAALARSTVCADSLGGIWRCEHASADDSLRPASILCKTFEPLRFLSDGTGLGACTGMHDAGHVRRSGFGSELRYCELDRLVNLAESIVRLGIGFGPLVQRVRESCPEPRPTQPQHSPVPEVHVRVEYRNHSYSVPSFANLLGS